MKIVTAPQNFIKSKEEISIFLAGSIDMGKAEPWQDNIINSFKDYDVTFLNPRRSDWNNDIEYKENNPYMYEQINWELKQRTNAHIVVFYFDKKGLSPISLLELGLTISQHVFTGQHIIVCCPEEFWRSVNVILTLQHYKINSFCRNLDDLKTMLKEKLK